jgi:hypothetical protein
VVGSLPRAYTYEVLRTAADPNYNIAYIPVSGTIPGRHHRQKASR